VFCLLAVNIVAVLTFVSGWAELSSRSAPAEEFPDLPVSNSLENSGIRDVTSTLTITTWLPLTTNHWCAPAVQFTYVPPYESFKDLQGRVNCVNPSSYKVAVYIFVSGWWTKPYWDQPLTTIQSDGTWTCDITTGGTDQLATKIAAFLVPNGYKPPPASGGQTLPAELYNHAVAQLIIDRPPVYRTIQFSGYTWKVKASETPAGPGPNYFSNRTSDIWVDAQGRLHLKIVYRDGRWYCTEVFSAVPFGYGTYTFTLASRVDQLDKNIVLGLFTWDDTAPEYNYRELDIEFSRWGEENGPNAQYVVQPWQHAGNRHQFSMTLHSSDSLHALNWQSDRVQFVSHQGHTPTINSEIETWSYNGFDIPPAGTGNARINLWLLNGAPPSNALGTEVIIQRFEFVPPSP
jgi:hypothetical protein